MLNQDDFPDLKLDSFLRVMQAFPDVCCEKAEHNYYRFRFSNQNPADPEPIICPIYAPGSLVRREQIRRLFERFNLSTEKLKRELNRS